MKRIVFSIALALLLAGTAVTTGGSRMTCEMTGQTMDTCCCVVENGAMVCTLTGETVSSCCCS